MTDKKLYKNKSAAIIGFGRFGKTLYKMIKPDFKHIFIYDTNKKSFQNFKPNKTTIILKNEKEIYKKADYIFYCIPISKFETQIKKHIKLIKPHNILIDTLSVKVHPYKVFSSLPSSISAILTHPMFGPDSAKHGLQNLPIVTYNFNAPEDIYRTFKKYLTQKGLKTVEMDPVTHDRLAAYSQGLTHFIGRLLEKMNFQPTPIDTKGAKKLYEIMEQTCNDTYTLFRDLQAYNPYTRNMRLDLGKSYDVLFKDLLPKRVDKKYTIFGIQGGKGSFNEQALLHYIKKHKIKDYKIKYLYTTRKVLDELYKGNIDYGQFAIHNAQGGVVWESVQAMSKYKFKIIEEFYIIISHHLMAKKKMKKEKVKTILAHPQVFKQCQHTLKRKYPKAKLISGKGDLIDTALAARKLSEGELPSHYTILGPENLATLYNLQIIDTNLQDLKQNKTYFLIVER